MRFDNRSRFLSATVAAAISLAVGSTYFFGHPGDWLMSWHVSANGDASAQGAPSQPANRAGSDPLPGDSVNLSDSQLASVKVEPVGEREFPIEKQAVGSIDFNEEMSVQVFTPYPGRIIGLFAKLGDDVKKG